jgi:hypothetical protein
MMLVDFFFSMDCAHRWKIAPFKGLIIVKKSRSDAAISGLDDG